MSYCRELWVIKKKLYQIRFQHPKIHKIYVNWFKTFLHTFFSLACVIESIHRFSENFTENLSCFKRNELISLIHFGFANNFLLDDCGKILNLKLPIISY